MNYEKTNTTLNVIVADDEYLTRKSTLRILHTLSRKSDYRINIIESSDGIETLYIIYKAINIGVQISLILSDDNMNFMNGRTCSSTLDDIYLSRNVKKVPFYLLTANDENYDENFIHNKAIESVISKPLSLKVAESIILKTFL